MIIDSHLHLGTSLISENKYTESDLVNALKENHVDAAVGPSLPGASNEVAAHNEIAALVSKHPGRFYGGITLNPHTEDSYGKLRDESQFFQEVERCVKQLGFVCLKLHPTIHNCPATSKRALKLFQAAQDFNIPLIIHTGLDVPNSLPALIIPRAKEFPRVKIVMAHSGAYMFTMEAFIVAEECPNVYLETSWCATHRIKQMVKQFGAQRVMFGSDIPSNIPTALAQYRSMGLSNAELDQCLSGTAQEVFKLKK